MKKSAFLRKIFRKEKKVYYYQRYFVPSQLVSKFREAGYKVVAQKSVDHTFSLLEFSSIFRDKRTFDGENSMAVRLSNILEKYFPRACAGSNLFILQK
jgi:hypothetical protein